MVLSFDHLVGRRAFFLKAPELFLIFLQVVFLLGRKLLPRFCLFFELRRAVEGHELEAEGERRGDDRFDR